VRAFGFRLVRERDTQVVPRSYYSPIPEPSEIGPEVWERRSELRGIVFDAAEQIAFAERELAAAVREFEAPLEPSGTPGEFHLHNAYYESVDAEIAYAMVRRFKPARVLELGSGHSTLVLAEACERNAGEGSPVEYVACNPYPFAGVVPEGLPGLTEHRRESAQEVDEARLRALGDGDILFVDTSHVVKIGGDVNRVVLDLMPILAPGVIVHFHDIWMPWEYHRVLVDDMQMSWSEQYLLQAFLIGNAGWRVLFAAQAVARDHGDRLQALVPSYTGENFPSSFWLRRAA
jgi:hypothetical protein